MIFDNRIKDTSDISVLLNGQQIKASPHVTFLGIIIDENLNWQQHVASVAKKISKINGIMNHLKNVLPQSALLTLYNTLVLPHLNYCLLVWGYASLSILSNLYKLQKRIIRNICNAHFRSSTVPLFSELRILSIFDLYKFQLGLFVYKFHNGILPGVFDHFYCTNSSFHNFNTRNRYTLTNPYSRTVLNKNQIRGTGVNLWNSLNPDLKMAKSANSFKRLFKIYLLQYSIGDNKCHINNLP